MKTGSIRSIISGVVLSLAVVACGGGDDPSAPQDVGTVKGVVYAADGVTPIPQATVTLAADLTTAPNGELPSVAVAQPGAPSTKTDVNGRFTLNNVPMGEQTILAKRGIFEATFNVTVEEGKTVTAPPVEIVSTGKLAYLPGSYDSIEDIVEGELQNPMDQLAPADFANATKLAEYKMIFVNCGSSLYEITSSTTTLATIRTWISNGGILYASDWANDLVEALYPADFSGELSGEAQEVTATIVDAELKAFVGKSTVAIQYDLGSWHTPATLSSAAKVLVRGSFDGYDQTYTNKPLAVYFAKGSGDVVYTSFHNEAGVTADQKAVLRYFIYLD
jgi:hypothetical protein